MMMTWWRDQLEQPGLEETQRGLLMMLESLLNSFCCVILTESSKYYLVVVTCVHCVLSRVPMMNSCIRVNHGHHCSSGDSQCDLARLCTLYNTETTDSWRLASNIAFLQVSNEELLKLNAHACSETYYMLDVVLQVSKNK